MYGLPLPYWLTLIAAALTAIAFLLMTLDRQCPFCARRWAFYRRGRDHVCRHCARDIDGRIRAAVEDPRPLRVIRSDARPKKPKPRLSK